MYMARQNAALAASPSKLSKLPLELRRKSGAGDGNRNRMTSLEGWGSTIELRPHDLALTAGTGGISTLSFVEYRFRDAPRTVVAAQMHLPATT